MVVIWPAWAVIHRRELDLQAGSGPGEALVDALQHELGAT
jgi:hypothetical protein